MAAVGRQIQTSHNRHWTLTIGSKTKHARFTAHDALLISSLFTVQTLTFLLVKTEWFKVKYL